MALTLAGMWLAIAVALNGPVAVAVWFDQPVNEPVVTLYFYGFAGLTFVGIPAFFAGVVAVSATRHPGTNCWWRRAARAALLAALTGPAEFLVLAAIYVYWRVVN